MRADTTWPGSTRPLTAARVTELPASVVFVSAPDPVTMRTVRPSLPGAIRRSTRTLLVPTGKSVRNPRVAVRWSAQTPQDSGHFQPEMHARFAESSPSAHASLVIGRYRLAGS